MPQHSSASAQACCIDLAAVIVNFNTAKLTARAIESCIQSGIAHVVVVDNASELLERALLRTCTASLRGTDVLQLDANTGFAGGVNHGVSQLLRHSPNWTHVLLLNSDAELSPAFPALIRQVGIRSQHLVCGRVDKAGFEPRGVESIGMTLHRSLIASEIRNPYLYPLLGPSGAFAILSRELIADLLANHGELLASAFFCYAEDTDLCVRARLLGYTPMSLDPGRVAAYHMGQASSGGKDSEFVFFHGVRNTLWMAARCVPLSALLRCLPWMFAAHCAILVKALRARRLLLALRVYGQTILALPRLLRERWRIQRSSRVDPTEFYALLSPSLYDREYLKAELRKVLTFRRAS